MLLNVRLHRCALWLALAAVLLRAMIPGGFMLGQDARSGEVGLIFCSAAAAEAPSARGADPLDPAKVGGGEHGSCAFALSALATPPSANRSTLPTIPAMPGEAAPAARAMLAQRSYPRPPSQAPPRYS